MMIDAEVDHQSCTICFGHAKIDRLWCIDSESGELLHNSSTKCNKEGIE